MAMHWAKEFVRAACSSWAAISWCKIVAKDICPRNLVLLEQPANKSGGRSSLWCSKWIGFAAYMFDPDGVLVCTHAMIRAVAVAHHLVNVAISINDIVRRNLSAICFLKFRQGAGKRAFSAVQNNFVDACAVAAGTVWALDELFDYRFHVRVAAAMTRAPQSRNGFCWYGSARRNCYPNNIVRVKPKRGCEPWR